jgi:hypothetical protein
MRLTLVSGTRTVSSPGAGTAELMPSKTTESAMAVSAVPFQVSGARASASPSVLASPARLTESARKFAGPAFGKSGGSIPVRASAGIVAETPLKVSVSVAAS